MAEELGPQSVYPNTPADPGMVWMGNPKNTAWKQVPSYQVPQAKSMGYRVVQPHVRPAYPGMSNSAGAAMRGLFGTPAPMDQSTAMGIAGNGVAAGTRLLGQSLPEMVPMMATAAFPEAKAAGWAARPLIAGATAAMSAPVGQVMQGQQPTLGYAQQMAGLMAGSQGLGEALKMLASKFGNTLALDAVNAPKAVRRSYPQIDEAVLQERIPASAPGKTTATSEVSKRGAENAAKMSAAVKASQTVHSVDDVMRQVDDQIAKLGRSAHPQDVADAARLKQLRDEFAAANPNGLTTEQLDDAVRSSQQRATGTYTKDEHGKTVSVQTTPEDQVYHRLFARQGRLELRRVPGVAATKDRAQMLKKLGDTYANLEATPQPKIKTLGDPTQTIPTMAQRTFLRPDIASGVGFAITDPAMLMALRQSPMAAAYLLQLLNNGAPPDISGMTGKRP